MNAEALTRQLDLLPEYLGGHLLLSLIALSAGILICLPLGLLVTRLKPLQSPVLTVASVLQTIPGIALLALMVPLLGRIGFLPALIALTLYSFLPILRNTVTGILAVDKAVVEAARGLGMTEWQLLARVEIPLALPVIIAGIRTAAVWVVGTATLATPVGATSLGNYVFSGLQTQNVTAILVGCFFAALLAIVIDLLIRLIEIALVKRSRPLLILGGAAMIILSVVGIAPSLSSSPATAIVIGSKPFTEQYILADLIDKKLGSDGFSTDLRNGMGSMILFEALANNEVDCYIDYSGTIWTNVLGRKDLPPREELLTQLTDRLADEFRVYCLGVIGFENTYALALPEQLAEQKQIRSIEDLSQYAPGLRMGSDYEFFSRPEWDALDSVYELNFAKLITMDPSLMYPAVEQGEVDVISAYSTDGRIDRFDLRVLKDSKQVLPPYDAIILLSAKANSNRKLVEQLKQFVGSIDNKTMQRANRLVDVDQQAVDSASTFLHNIIFNQ